MSHPPRRSPRCIALTVALLASACAEPVYVSLGRNIQTVAAQPDAGAAQPSTLSDPASPLCPQDLITGDPTEVPIDTPCEARIPLTCPDDLDRLLFDVIARCTDLAYRINATFEAGCATAFHLEPLEALVSPAVSDCVNARLSQERYDCAPAPCAAASTYPIPTR